MNNVSVCDELDQAIDRMIANTPARELAASATPAGMGELLEIAAELRSLPRADFKTRLMLELEWQGSGRMISAGPGRAAAGNAGDLEVFPTLLGKSNGLYPIRGGNVVASVALHAAMLLFASLAGLVMVKTTAKIDEPRFTDATVLDPYIPARIGSSANTGGGSGGAADKLGASEGARPRFANRELTAPRVVVIETTPKLPVEATLVGPPELNLPKTGPTGDPLSTLLTPSSGIGVGGIGSSDGDGDGPGHGPGGGPGSGGGTGGDFYGPGAGVTAPRAIYKPEPEFSEEARRVRYQGAVILSAVVGPDGRPRQLAVVRSLGMGLDEKAMEAVRNWRFEPGKKDGRPVAVQIDVVVDFHLY